MAIKGLLAARTKLKANSGLTAFFVGRYGKDAKHIVGYKRPVNANDFPAICYVPIRSDDPGEIGGMTKELVSLIIAINEPDFVSDIANGIIYGDQAETLVKLILNTGELGIGCMYLGEARTTTDLGTRHPFYEIEISCLFGSR